LVVSPEDTLRPNQKKNSPAVLAAARKLLLRLASGAPSLAGGGGARQSLEEVICRLRSAAKLRVSAPIGEGESPPDSFQDRQGKPNARGGGEDDQSASVGTKQRVRCTENKFCSGPPFFVMD